MTTPGPAPHDLPPGQAGSKEPERLRTFVLARTAPAPVPLAPELVLLQASDMHELWRAAQAEPPAWQDSPYWAFPWAGGQALARYVLEHPEVVRGRRVADFATGSGLVAIAAARAGAAEVLALDRDPFAEVAVGLNADLNGVAVRFRAGDALGESLPGVEVLLAGDVFYERGLADGALRWFAALAARGVRVLAGDACRTYAPREGVTELAWFDVPTTTAIEAAGVRRARVLELRP
ncbi:MAG TPA: 50S ribosomal protein L11 methyltransferase [Anaeromyxobacter sp.]|nr:50S ribosomal protein L11 methyltransferase [Anaeromyxobacter sp.]